MLMRSLAAAALLAVSATPALAQGPGTDSEIVVTGTREEIRRELYDMLTVTNRLLSRFEAPLCPFIAGFDAEHTAHLRNLIVANTAALGVEMAEPGCRSNALIVFTDDPQKLMEGFRRRHPNMFGQLSLSARDRLMKPARTSYSWHATYVAPAANASEVDASGALGLFGSGFGPPTFFTPSSLKLNPPAISVMGAAYLVLDINRTPGMTLQQIADFATIRLLVDLEDDVADTARPDSILNLFDAASPGDAAPRLSAFDKALVRSLYEPYQLNLDSNRMRMRLTTLMRRGLEGKDEK